MPTRNSILEGQRHAHRWKIELANGSFQNLKGLSRAWDHSALCPSRQGPFYINIQLKSLLYYRSRVVPNTKVTTWTPWTKCEHFKTLGPRRRFELLAWRSVGGFRTSHIRQTKRLRRRRQWYAARTTATRDCSNTSVTIAPRARLVHERSTL